MGQTEAWEGGGEAHFCGLLGIGGLGVEKTWKLTCYPS